DDVRARLQIQMVGIGQNSLCTKLFHGLRQNGLDGGLGAYGDERRRVDVAVRRADDAGTTRPSGQFGVNAEERLAHAVDSALLDSGVWPPPRQRWLPPGVRRGRRTTSRRRAP